MRKLDLGVRATILNTEKITYTDLPGIIMNRMKKNNHIANWGFKNLFISTFVFFTVNVSAVEQIFYINSVSVLPNDQIEIKFGFMGNSVTELEVKYVPDLDNYLPVDIPDYSYDDNSVTFTFYDEGVLTFKLIARIDGEWEETYYHSTIFLREIESSSIGCKVAVDALWTNYAIYTSIDPPAPPVPAPFDNSELRISRYNVDNGTCATAEIAVYGEPLSFADSEITTPISIQINPNHRYCFRVRSFSETDTTLFAYSNYEKDVQISDIIAPQHVEIISVDVDYGAENIVVTGSSNDENVDDFVFDLYRSTDGIDFPDDPVQQLLGTEINPDQFSFIDDVDVDEGPYYYSVKSVNKECEIYFFEAADIVPSIFLETSLTVVGTDLQIIFEWNYDDSFDSYQNARLEINGQETPIIFGNEDYTESLSIEELGTLITSWIQAEDMEGNTVRSNRTELRIDILDRENIPNAFRPRSNILENQTFILPFIIDNTNILDYNISIIDKNGQEVFSYDGYYHETDSAWNGRIMNTGPDAPAGAYVYELKYAITGSPSETKRGVVYLIR